MRHHSRLVIAIAILLVVGVAPASATNYYACDCETGAHGSCSAGSDANDGLSSVNPKETWNAIRALFVAGGAGDNAYFCEGGAFQIATSADWSNSACSAGSPCTVTTYDPGTGATGKPKLNGAAGLDVFLVNGVDYITFRDFEAIGNVSGSTWDNENVTQIDGSASDLVFDGVDANGGWGRYAIVAAATEASRITWQNCTIREFAKDALIISGDDLIVQDCDISEWGSGGNRHGIYFSGLNAPASSDRGIIRRNTLHSPGSINESSPTVNDNEACQGVVIVSHQNSGDLLIEDNYIHPGTATPGNGCWGIALTEGNTNGETITNATIRGNIVEDVGNLLVGVDMCVDCTIENNVLIQMTPKGGTAISVPVSGTKEREGGTADTLTTNSTIRNNTILGNASGGFHGISIGITYTAAPSHGSTSEVEQGTSHEVVSNVIVYLGTGEVKCFLPTIDPTNQTDQYDAFDYNFCYAPSGTHVWSDNPTGDYVTLQNWRDINDTLDVGENSQNADPGLTDTTGPVYDLSASSGSANMVGAGHPTLSSSTDVTGASRGVAPFDSGAYEEAVTAIISGGSLGGGIGAF